MHQRGNVLRKLENGDIPTWRNGMVALDNLTSIQRNSYKVSDANKMSAILLEEFATGKGDKITDFEETDAFTKQLNKNDVLLKDVIGGFYKKMRSTNIKSEDYLLSQQPDNIYKTGYSFSPDHTSIKESWQKHIDAWQNNSIAFVIGGMSVQISKINNDFKILYSNTTGLKSLALHLVNDYDPEYRDLLANIKQTFTFILTKDEFREFNK